MTGAKRYKVCAIVPRADGTGEYFQKIGNAFVNKDNSFNAYLETLPLNGIGPKGLKIHIREYSEAELAAMAATRDARRSTGPQGATASTANEEVPF